MTADSIRLHRLIPRITTLGPYLRLGIWTQGCRLRCEGCITPEARDPDGGRLVPFDEIVNLLIKFPEQEGITISGGEPFLQALALCRLIDRFRSKRDTGVIVYSGFLLSALRHKNAPEGSQELLERTDLLIDGPYVAALNDNGALRGSSNQRVIPLTERYRDCLDLYGTGRERRTELRYTEEGLGVVGVPPLHRGDAHE